ncbi:hypothetical protein AB0D14_43980 [Streptomyces sp. NPDC048484]|uniref:hypothetical protein n=1 Tax=Streptomyces sp. NPDC048484 TaxID=3155146 RepID=UPI0034212110
MRCGPEADVCGPAAQSPTVAGGGTEGPCGDADWGLYVFVHRDLMTGIVLAEARVTIGHGAGSSLLCPGGVRVIETTAAPEDPSAVG